MTRPPGSSAQLLRDLFLGSLGLGILYDQVLVAHAAQPILIFLVIFLFGSIKALRGDDRPPGQYSPFVRIIMKMLGVEFPENFSDNESGTTPSSSDTPPSSDGQQPARSRPRRSSSRKAQE